MAKEISAALTPGARMDQRTIVTSWMAVLAVFACAGIGAAQVPTSSTGSAGPADVLLRPGDVLRITVWPNAEAGGEYTIEDSGYVMLPLLEAVRAAGVPIGELRADLRQRYAQAMRNPVVTVTPMFRVTVTGEVMRPGIQVITPTYSLFEVIGQAGGFRPGADAEKVRIVRSGEVIHYDALRALETGEGMDAIQLRSGDHIVVPPVRRSLISFNTVMSAIQTATLVAVLYDRFTRASRR